MLEISQCTGLKAEKLSGLSEKLSPSLASVSSGGASAVIVEADFEKQKHSTHFCQQCHWKCHRYEELHYSLPCEGQRCEWSWRLTFSFSLNVNVISNANVNVKSDVISWHKTLLQCFWKSNSVSVSESMSLAMSTLMSIWCQCQCKEWYTWHWQCFIGSV